jgi:ferrous-iron efflux pump FieF
MSTPTRGGSDPAKLLRLATYASVATATTLIAVKLVAWLLTGSVSVLASLVDSLLDGGASLVNLLAVRYALMAPDAEHRFGHGKAESLAGLAQATFIAGSAVFLVLHAIERLRAPQPLEAVGVGIAVMGFAILATAALLVLQHYVIRRTASTAIRADALHYRTDLLTNASVIAALLLASAGWAGMDAVFGILIALYVLYSAGQIALEAFHILMDRELPDAERERIRALAGSHPQVVGVHDLRTRRSGPQVIIQFHLELDGSLSLAAAHAIGDAAVAAVRTEYPDADITVHQDPVTPRAGEGA